MLRGRASPGNAPIRRYPARDPIANLSDAQPAGAEARDVQGLQAVAHRRGGPLVPRPRSP